MNILRKYSLGTQDNGIGSDTSYSLIFTTDGRMFVRVFKDYTQDYKTPDVDEVALPDIGTATVNGQSVLALALEKLQQILPDSN